MPSKDLDPATRPENDWMRREGLLPGAPGRQSGTSGAARGTGGSRTAQREMSAQVQRLARRLGADADELAAKIPPDTLRRTKYGVLETVNADGTRTFKHDAGIEDGPRNIVLK
jgi:hypothetical protein